MLERYHGKFVLIILIVALALRLGVLLFNVNLPVMWDARRYVGAAIALLSYIDNSGPVVMEDTESDREAFDFYYHKYIQGEQIEWLYYQPTRLQGARDDIFFSGPLYPAVLAILFAVSPVSDFTVARLFGIAGDVLALWLLVLISTRLVGRRASLVAGLLYAVYFPFVLTSTSLLLGSSTNLLLLGAVLLAIRAVENDRGRPLVWAGLLLGLLVLNKPTAMLLSLPVLVGLYFYSRNIWSCRKFAFRSLGLIIPLAVIMLSWFAVSSVKYGRPALRDPDYSGANIRQSSSLKYEGYNLDQVEPEFWQRKPYDDLFKKLPDYVGLFAKKFERLYSRPYNDFERHLILPPGGQELIHLVIIVFGLLGLLHLLSRDLTKAIWPLVIVSYYTGIHLIYHSINRYSFNVLPFVMICAAGMIVVLWDRSFSGSQKERRLIWIGIGALLTAWGVQPGLLDLIHIPMTEPAVWGLFIIKIALLGFAAFLFLRESGEVKRYILAGVFALVSGATVWSQELSRNAWGEFSADLSNPGQKAGTRIFCSNFLQPAAGERFFLALDLDIPDRLDSGYRLGINNNDWTFPAGYDDPTDFFFTKTDVYQAYARFVRKSLTWFRQYRLMALPVEIVQDGFTKDGYLDISVQIPTSSLPGQSLSLHGSRNCGSDSVYIPSPEAADASIERWVHRKDARIRIPVDFLSDSTISYYITDNQPNLSKDQDLGTSSGRQTGRYNIFLIRVEQDNEFTVY